MIRIKAGIIIRCMTAFASVGRIVVIALVTSIAVGRNRDMRTSKRINTAVIKCRGRPGGFTVAKRAIGRELLSLVIGIGSAQIVAIVAAVAGIGGIVVIAIVAGGTIVGDSGMCPV